MEQSKSNTPIQNKPKHEDYAAELKLVENAILYTKSLPLREVLAS